MLKMDLRQEWDTLFVLWRRDLMRFWRQPSRLVGALGQPIIFWGVIGSGMTRTFRLDASGGDYMTFFFPGVVMMVLVFASIFASVSVIEDRHQGFLQAVLVAPGSRLALVLGKCLGAATVALIQVGLFLLLLPYSGLHFSEIAWAPLAVALFVIAMGLSALGLAIAWRLDNTQAYHAVQMTLLVPMWVISGAMFPLPEGQGVLFFAMRLNPLAYATTWVRHALWGGCAPATTVLHASLFESAVVVTALSALSLGLAARVTRGPKMKEKHHG